MRFSLEDARPVLQRTPAVLRSLLEGLPEAIRFSAAGITENQIRPLWDAPLIFLLLIGFKAAEWLLRRRWNTI